MALDSLKIVLLLSILAVTYGFEGATCSNSVQCGPGTFCQENKCRKDGCTISAQCQGEICEYGNVNGRLKPACFPSHQTKNTENFCPGGGAVVMGFDGQIATCDMGAGCTAKQVCNPQNGFCCTKLRTCPKPAKVMISHLTGMPIMCQFKFGIETPCPTSGYCEAKTGFCCQQTGGKITEPNPSVPNVIAVKPVVGQTCENNVGCSGGAICNCENYGTCKCQCPTELGYSVSSDGKSCQRLRRRLKEKCKTDMECSAAFSECSTGGCRCKAGFQRDGDGGCKPIKYRCPGNSQPVLQNEKPVTCHRRAVFTMSRHLNTNITDQEFEELMGNSSLSDWSDTKPCPENHYCVALFDDAMRPGFYQGFCCPTPSDLRPVCPVGEAHESSYFPDFGCTNCPIDYYCHKDGVVTEKSICCPKPCTSMDDIYHNGQCLPSAFYGDSCIITAQCSSAPTIGEDDSEMSPLECRKSICQCTSGFSHANGQCKRVTCTVGLRGEPSVDRNNELVTCKRTSDCSQGQLCDVSHNVCCKGINRCPLGLEETGEQCSSDGLCSRPAHSCHLANAFKKIKICCMTP